MGPEACPMSNIVPNAPMADPEMAFPTHVRHHGRRGRRYQSLSKAEDQAGRKQRPEPAHEGDRRERERAQRKARHNERPASPGIRNAPQQRLGEHGHDDLSPPKQARLELREPDDLHRVHGQERFQRSPWSCSARLPWTRP